MPRAHFPLTCNPTPTAGYSSASCCSEANSLSWGSRSPLRARERVQRCVLASDKILLDSRALPLLFCVIIADREKDFVLFTHKKKGVCLFVLWELEQWQSWIRLHLQQLGYYQGFYCTHTFSFQTQMLTTTVCSRPPKFLSWFTV